jgi:hypothetical protein
MASPASSGTPGILRTIGGQNVVRVRAPGTTIMAAGGQQIKVVGSSGQIIKSTTVSDVNLKVNLKAYIIIFTTKKDLEPLVFIGSMISMNCRKKIVNFSAKLLKSKGGMGSMATFSKLVLRPSPEAKVMPSPFAKAKFQIPNK